ncbi:hypothetical protein [Neorhodopirellula pilleata]|uniref:Uncharacterized protein n=1 Tax=Neorhodopirellula pilleata TaxID=2714738 RepID=A0A5C6AWL1_9BACT|nr:hypothetical protein [Neorhodopirellula pilleata]TWU04018.1 hypothetical protein Pla100_09540 [Neorhodopirellula pilleata]
MSEPASFVIIRDGERRTYFDSWAHVFMYRNLVWGPEELDRWLRQESPDQESEDEHWSDDVCGGVVVDFDQRRLVWDGDDQSLEVPRVANVLRQLMAVSWPGYEIRYAARGVQDLVIAAGETKLAHALTVEDSDLLADLLDDRPETVLHASGRYEDDDEEDENGDEDEEEEEYDDGDDDDVAFFGNDELRAWITLINERGAVRHRHLSEISQDLFGGGKQSIEGLLKLDSAEVPAEKVVREGIWFDFGKRKIGVWGGPKLHTLLPMLQRNWKGWEVAWATGGYADQCAASGPSGIPMSDAEALASLTPKILSTKRFDLSTIFGAVGSSIKRTAIKATGCLAMLLSAPVVLFGLIAGQLKAALITIAIVCVGLTIAFKVIERRFKKKFTDGPIGEMTDRDKQRGGRATVAGPLDENERSKKLDQLLAAAGLPPLAVIANHVDPDNTFDGLM